MTEPTAQFESLRRSGYAIAAAALRDAADDLGGRKGAPRNRYEFRAWLRARADNLETGVTTPCASCGAPSIHRIVRGDQRVPVCLRHLNHWRTPDGDHGDHTHPDA